MAKLPVEKMRELERRFGEIEARMSAGPDSETYVRLASEYSELQPVVTKIREYLDAARKDERVTAMQSSRIGIEGETRLCIEFRDAASAAELGAQVRAMAGDVELLNVVEETCPTGEKQP